MDLLLIAIGALGVIFIVLFGTPQSPYGGGCF
jgi:hypothetical protein